MSPYCIVETFWKNSDEEYKEEMLKIFLKLNYEIETDKPYNYITYFTDKNLKIFLQCF